VQKVTKESIKNTTEKLQKEVKKITNDHTGIEIIYDTIRGIPYEEIIREQEDKRIDLIVIASHGKTGILKNLLGGGRGKSNEKR
jgi:nucleotide-binding universal stress UspA family protein